MLVFERRFGLYLVNDEQAPPCEFAEVAKLVLGPKPSYPVLPSQSFDSGIEKIFWVPQILPGLVQVRFETSKDRISEILVGYASFCVLTAIRFIGMMRAPGAIFDYAH